MPTVPKTSRRNHSSETISIILKLHEIGLSASKISNKTNNEMVGRWLKTATRDAAVKQIGLQRKNLGCLVHP